MRRTLVIAVLASLVWVTAAQVLLLGSGFTKEERAALIREFGSEVYITKIPLPPGKRGIYVNNRGEIDNARAIEEFKSHGNLAVVLGGKPIKITKVKFSGGDIIFEINGGWKSGKKWYEHIEVGVGNTTAPVSPQNQNLSLGSYITLTEAEGMTAKQVKEVLGKQVFDFEKHTPTVLYSPNVPPEIREAIKKHEVVVGMTREAVIDSRGFPDRKVRETRNGVEQEDWIYGTAPHVLFVTFNVDGDKVVAVRQY